MRTPIGRWAWTVLAWLGGLLSSGAALQYLPASFTPPLPAREFRAAWVATVNNIDWPSKPGLTVPAQKAELLALLDSAARLRLNAIDQRHRHEFLGFPLEGHQHRLGLGTPFRVFLGEPRQPLQILHFLAAHAGDDVLGAQRRLALRAGPALPHAVHEHPFLVAPVPFQRPHPRKIAHRQPPAFQLRLIARVPQYNRQLEDLKKMGADVSSEAQALDLQRNVQAQAAISGVQVNTYSPATRGSGKTNAFFEESSGTLQVATEEKSLVDFLWALGSGNSLIRVKSMQVQPDQSCGGHFREEYQYPDGEARRDDENFAHVAAWEYHGPGKAPERHVEPLVYEEVKMVTRSYK